jgi:anti-sigma factor (TIGR02949 family)
VRLDRELTCAQVVELVTLYLDRELTTDDVERFEEHLAFCGGCSAYLEQIRATIDATGRLRTDDLPAGLQERLLSSFRDWRPT